MTWNRRLIVTKKYKIGLTPIDAEVGDMFNLFWGWSVPVTLRKYPKNGKHEGKYILIGECYTHGIMNGEWTEKQAGIVEVKDDLNKRVEIV